MYSPAAWPPCQANTAPVKATPMLIHTADSMAASLVVGAWGVRWTRSRSAISRVETNARNATQIQIGTSKLAKFSRELDDSDARTARDTCYLRLYPDGLPAEGLARRGGRARRANRGRIDDRARRGYSPSVHGSLPAVAGDLDRRSAGIRAPRTHDGLGCGQARDRYPERRARHVVEPDPLEERDRRRVAPVLA